MIFYPLSARMSLVQALPQINNERKIKVSMKWTRSVPWLAVPSNWNNWQEKNPSILKVILSEFLLNRSFSILIFSFWKVSELIPALLVSSNPLLKNPILIRSSGMTYQLYLRTWMESSQWENNNTSSSSFFLNLPSHSF